MKSYIPLKNHYSPQTCRFCSLNWEKYIFLAENRPKRLKTYQLTSNFYSFFSPYLYPWLIYHWQKFWCFIYSLQSTVYSLQSTVYTFKWFQIKWINIKNIKKWMAYKAYPLFHIFTLTFLLFVLSFSCVTLSFFH